MNWRKEKPWQKFYALLNEAIFFELLFKNQRFILEIPWQGQIIAQNTVGCFPTVFFYTAFLDGSLQPDRRS